MASQGALLVINMTVHYYLDIRIGKYWALVDCHPCMTFQFLSLR